MNALQLREGSKDSKPLRRVAATALASLVCYWLALDRSNRPPPQEAPPPMPEAPAQATSLQVAFGIVADSVKPSVVSIRTVQFLDPPRKNAVPKSRRWVEGIGSGVVVDPRGYILTNEHVIRGADRIEITVAGPAPQLYVGTLVKSDEELDLALVRISPRKPLPAAKFGDSSSVRVGDWAIAVGSPFGLAQTVTVGVISAVRQSFKVESHVYTDFFQTDAAINRGNSGGPLVNVRGEIIGINTAIYGPTGVFSGIGFAIPSNQAKDLVDTLGAQVASTQVAPGGKAAAAPKD